MSHLWHGALGRVAGGEVRTVKFGGGGVDIFRVHRNIFTWEWTKVVGRHTGKLAMRIQQMQVALRVAQQRVRVIRLRQVRRREGTIDRLDRLFLLLGEDGQLESILAALKVKKMQTMN